MNNKQIFDMIGQLDDKYILEGYSEPKRNISVKRRIPVMLIAAALSAALLGVVGAGAAIYNGVHKDSVSQFYNESTLEKLESGGYTLGAAADSFTYDDYSGLSVITIDALDDKAREYLSENKGMVDGLIYYADTGDDVSELNTGVGFMGINEYENGRPFVMQAEILFKYGAYVNIDISRPLGIRFDTVSTQWVEDPDKTLFEGIKFVLPMENKVKSTMLYSDDGQELYLSETDFVAMIDPLKEFDPFYQIRWNDGTEFDKDLCLTLGLSGGGLFLNGENKGYITYFRELVDIDKAESITFDGVEYKRP